MTKKRPKIVKNDKKKELNLIREKSQGLLLRKMIRAGQKNEKLQKPIYKINQSRQKSTLENNVKIARAGQKIKKNIEK